MKKLATIVLVLAAFAAGCSSSKSQIKDESSLEVEYSALTRGSNLNYVITKYTITVKERTRASELPARVINTPVKDWEALVGLIKEADLKTIETQKAPSVKHQYDGAMAASIKITADGQTYRSVTFDHGNPPAKLKALADKIMSMAGVEKPIVNED